MLVNEAELKDMTSVLKTNKVALGLDFNFHDELSAASQEAVALAVFNGKLYTTYASVKEAFDTAVRNEFIKKIEEVAKDSSAKNITITDLKAAISGTTTMLNEYSFTDAYGTTRNLSLEVYQGIISSCEDGELDNQAKITAMIIKANSFINTLSTFIETNHNKFVATGEIGDIVLLSIDDPDYELSINGTDPVSTYSKDGKILKDGTVKVSFTVNQKSTDYKVVIRIAIDVDVN